MEPEEFLEFDEEEFFEDAWFKFDVEHDGYFFYVPRRKLWDEFYFEMKGEDDEKESPQKD